MSDQSINLGVDIGGTFTDVVLEKDNRIWSVKVLTTYGAPEDAILDGIGFKSGHPVNHTGTKTGGAII